LIKNAIKRSQDSSGAALQVPDDRVWLPKVEKGQPGSITAFGDLPDDAGKDDPDLAAAIAASLETAAIEQAAFSSESESDSPAELPS
jgi:hypothetical protein